MSSQFYNSIIEDEIRICHIKDELLKIAAKHVSETYSPSALKVGSTFLEYNTPQNRCAYLFKYAALHTELVAKCFKAMLMNDTVQFILEHKRELKICCLGGGPGTDVVGLFKALATLPACYQKVSEVTVLDLCGGWRNSFNHIISRLKHGKVDGVPAKFVDSSNFKAKLIAVDLLGDIPDNVLKIISSADIVCMVKFISAIMGKPESINALKVIGDKLKAGCMVLFMDNVYDKLFVSLDTIFKQTGLIAIFGPSRVAHKRSVTKSKDNIYGCSPTRGTRVTVVGSIKTSTPVLYPITEFKTTPDFRPELTSNSENDDGWDTESDSEDISPDLLLPSALLKSKNNSDKRILESTIRTTCDKFTQTQSKYFKKDKQASSDSSIPEGLSELPSLVGTLSDLLNVMKELTQLKQKSRMGQCGCSCIKKQHIKRCSHGASHLCI